MTVARECDNHQVEVIKKVCQLMQRCDGPGGGVEGLGKV